MAVEIYIKLGDKFFEEVFQEKFQGFKLEKDGFIIRIPIERLLEILRDEYDEKFHEMIKEQKDGSKNAQGHKKNT